MNRSVEELERLTNQRILGDLRIQRGTFWRIWRSCRRGKFDGERTTRGFTQDGGDSIHVRLDETGGRRIRSFEPDSDAVGIPGIELQLDEQGLVGASSGCHVAGMVPKTFGGREIVTRGGLLAVFGLFRNSLRGRTTRRSGFRAGGRGNLGGDRGLTAGLRCSRSS